MGFICIAVNCYETYGGGSFPLICKQKVAKEGGEKWKSMTDAVSTIFLLFISFAFVGYYFVIMY